MLKYVIISTLASNKQIFFNNIEATVRVHKLTKEIQLIKVEKGAKGGQFYYGLGIVTDDTEQSSVDDVEGRLYRFLRHNRSLGTVTPSPGGLLPHLFSEEEIKTFLTGKLEWRNFNYDIRFEIDEDYIWTNESDFRVEHEGEELSSENFDKLLWWASARGGGSYEAFEQACRELDLLGDYVTPWSILMKLVLLGHAEITRDTKGFAWSIVPTTAVKKDATKDNYFLVGKQTPKLLLNLEQSSLMKIDKNSNSGFEPILLKLSEDGSLASHQINKIENAAIIRAKYLPNIKDWIKNLEIDPFISTRAVVIETDFSLYDGKKFKPYQKDKERVLGFYRIEKREKYIKHRFFDGGYWLAGSYADLRFLDYHYKLKSIKKVLYDNHKKLLLVEERFKWPLMYERAIVLASGKLPKRSLRNNASYLIYENISKELLQMLSEKLEIKVEYRN